MGVEGVGLQVDDIVLASSNLDEGLSSVSVLLETMERNLLLPVQALFGHRRLDGEGSCSQMMI